MRYNAMIQYIGDGILHSRSRVQNRNTGVYTGIYVYIYRYILCLVYSTVYCIVPGTVDFGVGSRQREGGQTCWLKNLTGPRAIPAATQSRPIRIVQVLTDEDLEFQLRKSGKDA